MIIPMVIHISLDVPLGRTVPAGTPVVCRVDRCSDKGAMRRRPFFAEGKTIKSSKFKCLI